MRVSATKFADGTRTAPKPGQNDKFEAIRAVLARFGT